MFFRVVHRGLSKKDLCLSLDGREKGVVVMDVFVVVGNHIILRKIFHHISSQSLALEITVSLVPSVRARRSSVIGPL